MGPFLVLRGALLQWKRIIYSPLDALQRYSDMLLELDGWLKEECLVE